MLSLTLEKVDTWKSWNLNNFKLVKDETWKSWNLKKVETWKSWNLKNLKDEIKKK